MFERLASDRTHTAKAVDWREFTSHPKRFLDAPAEQQIWFFHRVNAHQVEPLLGAYTLESRSAAGRGFQVLVPSAK